MSRGARMSRIQLRLEDALHHGQQSFVGFHLSTFDIPRSAVAELDKDAGLLTYTFKYVDDEAPGPSQRWSDDIAIDAGRHSGKLLAIRINIKRYPVGEMRVSFKHAIDEIDKALNKSIRQLKIHHRKKNYLLIKSVIDDNRGSIENAVTD